MILVAVSGGIDSMCLAEKVRLSGGPFAIAHCNFGLRGAESDGDEAFVRRWAEKYGIDCHVKHFDTLEYAAAEKISTEMAARRLRYHWFGSLCREHGYKAVAVAHNANDNAETLILNLLRGTGPKGLTGMKAEGFIPDPEYADIPLLRPLLGMTREEIEAFAAEHAISWREDHTNAQNDYKRNKIRNLVFPVFKEINPSFIKTLNDDMARFAEYVQASEVLFPESVATLGRIRGRGPACWEGSRSDDSGNNTSDANTNQHSVIPGLTGNLHYQVAEEPWDGSESVVQQRGMLILDADKAGEYVEGHWEQGDWIKPLGAPGKKKLQDWFTDHHICPEEKHSVLLLKRASDLHHVLAIAGHCIDNSVRVTDSTRRILRIKPRP